MPPTGKKTRHKRSSSEDLQKKNGAPFTVARVCFYRVICPDASPPVNDKKEGACGRGEGRGAEKSLLSDPGSELRLGREKLKKICSKTIDGKIKTKQNNKPSL